MKFTMAHEVGHRFFYFVYPNIRAPIRPNWLDEGLAMYVGIEVSQQVEFAFRPVVQSVKTGQPPLAELDALDKLQESRSTLDLFYGEAATVIYFISTSYGEQALKQILVEYNGSKNLPEAFKQVLGVTYSDFEKAWINRIRDIGKQVNSGTEFYCVLTEKTPSTTVVPIPTSTSTSAVGESPPSQSQFPLPLVLISLLILVIVAASIIIRRRSGKRGVKAQKPQKPHVCSHCGRDLSTLPRDITICPYCGREVSTPSIEAKPAVKVELPAEIKRIRRYAKMAALLGLAVAVASFIFGPLLGGFLTGPEPNAPYMFPVLHECQGTLGSVSLVGILIAGASALVRVFSDAFKRRG